MKNTVRRVPLSYAWWFATCAILLACGSPPEPKVAKKIEAPPSTPPTTEVELERDRLIDELPSEPPPSLIAALPESSRRSMDALLESLAAEERSALASDESDLALYRPLLHLMAGGRSPDAYYALATTAAAAAELTLDVPDEHVGALVGVVNQVVRRAADEVLFSARQRLRGGQAVDEEFCRRSLRVAILHGHLAALKPAAKLCERSFDAPQLRLQLGRAFFRLGAGTQAAKAEFAAALRQAPGGSEDRQEAEALLRDIDRVGAEANDLPGAISAARAALRVSAGRTRGAAEPTARALDRYASEATRHLGLATTVLLLSEENTLCPRVRAGLGDPRICAHTLKKHLLETEAYERLTAAWHSGAGRDAESIQHYLGLSQVLPWRTSTPTGVAAEQTVKRADRLVVASEAATVDLPELRGISVFARAVLAGAKAQLAAKQGQAPVVESKEQEQLVAGAERLLETSPTSRFTQGAALATASVLAHHRDLRAFIRTLPSDVSSDYRVPMVTLTAWLAAAWQDTELLAIAHSRAIQVLSALPPESAERSLIVLLLAEAGYAISPDKKSAAVLRQASESLAKPNVPVELSLRAALDLAQLHEKSGKVAEAKAVLDGVLPIVSHMPKAHPYGGLVAVIAARRLLLGGGQPSVELFNQLSWPERLPAGILYFRDAWRAELAHRARLADCTNGGCRRRSKATRDRVLSSRDKMLGSLPAALTERDVLTSGSISMSFDYDPVKGLVPQLAALPEIILVPFPH